MQKIIKRIILMLFVLVFVLPLVGCDEVVEEVDLTEDINMYSNVNGNEKERIRELFSKHETILNDYFIEYKRNSSDKLYRQDAVSIIYSSAKGLSYSINPFILIVLMELKSNAITNPDFKKEDLDYIMGVTDEEYREYLGISKEKSDIKSNSLQRQLTWIGNELNNLYSCYSNKANSCGINLKYTTIDYLYSLNISNKMMSIYSVLDKLADNKEEWEEWTGEGNNSFIFTYNKFFKLK